MIWSISSKVQKIDAAVDCFKVVASVFAVILSVTFRSNAKLTSKVANHFSPYASHFQSRQPKLVRKVFEVFPTEEKTFSYIQLFVCPVFDHSPILSFQFESYMVLVKSWNKFKRGNTLVLPRAWLDTRLEENVAIEVLQPCNYTAAGDYIIILEPFFSHKDDRLNNQYPRIFFRRGSWCINKLIQCL